MQDRTDPRDIEIAELRECIAAHHRLHEASKRLLRAQTRLAFVLGFATMFFAVAAWRLIYG